MKNRDKIPGRYGYGGLFGNTHTESRREGGVNDTDVRLDGIPESGRGLPEMMH